MGPGQGVTSSAGSPLQGAVTVHRLKAAGGLAASGSTPSLGNWALYVLPASQKGAYTHHSL